MCKKQFLHVVYILVVCRNRQVCRCLENVTVIYVFADYPGDMTESVTYMIYFACFWVPLTFRLTLLRDRGTTVAGCHVFTIDWSLYY